MKVQSTRMLPSQLLHTPRSLQTVISSIPRLTEKMFASLSTTLKRWLLVERSPIKTSISTRFKQTLRSSMSWSSLNHRSQRHTSHPSSHSTTRFFAHLVVQRSLQAHLVLVAHHLNSCVQTFLRMLLSMTTRFHSFTSSVRLELTGNTAPS